MDAIKEAVRYEENPNSMFDLDLIRKTNREMIVSEELGLALEKSEGIRFLVLARFHDAKIISIRKDIIYGKEAVELIIDFSFAETNVFKQGIRKCKIQFINAESNFDFEQALGYYINYHILACEVELIDAKYKVTFKIYLTQQGDGYEDILEIYFERVNVSTVDKKHSTLTEW